MGQKANPKALRLKNTQEYENNWFTISNYADYLEQDFYIDQFLNKKLIRSAVSKTHIERKSGNQIKIDIYTAKPGFVLGKGGESITRLKKELEIEFKKNRFILNVIEEKKPDKSAKLLAELVAFQLEKRIPFRRAMKMIIQNALKSGAEGVQVKCAGRLGGTEIARSEWYQEGRMPRQTFRARIDYHATVASTIYGKIGVKVWVNNGEQIESSQTHNNTRR
jgi:small subunit ribosomal protein S3